MPFRARFVYHCRVHTLLISTADDQRSMCSRANWFVILGIFAGQCLATAQSINLPTSKQILEPVPGSPAA